MIRVMNKVMQILVANDQEEEAATYRLFPLVYKVRQLAARKMAHEPPGQTLQAIALIHEANPRLLGSERGALSWA